MTESRKRRLRNKIQASRARLMAEHPFFALLLMYLRFVAVYEMKKISTNGRCIYFSPDFLDKLYEFELDYILCHQIMHIIYGQIWRPFDLAGDNYHFACDIYINCQLEKLGFEQEYLPHVGYVYKTVPISGDDPANLTPDMICFNLPFNLYSFEERERNKFLPDTDIWWDKREDDGRDGVIILDIPEMDSLIRGNAGSKDDGQNGDEDEEKGADTGVCKENGKTLEGASKRGWRARAAAAAESLQKTQGSRNGLGIGDVPGFIQRMIKNAKEPTVDWRKILNDFVQEQTCDYSFSPPDRRFEETGFFLPDFNERDFVCRDILFMVDTSGSVDDDDLGTVYSEMRESIEQFGGKLSGKLGFFDVDVTAPRPFETVDDLMQIHPYGGGGTNFYSIFDHIRYNYKEELPACVVIFTDGFGEYPPQDYAMGIPVLWMINNEDITPPWGKTTRVLPRRTV